MQKNSTPELRKAVASNPGNGQVWLALAQQLAKQKPTDELRQAIQRSIELLPDEYQAWLLAGLEQQYRQGPAVAQQWLLTVARQKKGIAAPRLASAQLQAITDPTSARESFRQLARDFPADSRAYVLLAELQQNQGDLPGACESLERALAIKSDVVENWTALALMRFAEGHFEAVVDAANKALELDGRAVSARFVRAEAYRQAGQWDKAIPDYGQLIKNANTNFLAQNGMGACLVGKRHFEESLQHFRAALELKPDHTEARLNMALVLATQAKREEALGYLSHVLSDHSIPPQLREPAISAQIMVKEHQRLQPRLEAALQRSNLDDLVQSLAQTPKPLLQTDDMDIAKLREIAEDCDRLDFGHLEISLIDGQQYLSFIEACLHSRLPGGVEAMAEIWKEIHSSSSVPNSSKVVRKIDSVWHAILDRKEKNVGMLVKQNGEAWLRYWHCRLFSGEPDHLPGQFKIAPNSIGLHKTTAPQCVAASFRMLAHELRDLVSPGINRALFMLSAINIVHGFIDGNGRLARFSFEWELEQAGFAPILIDSAMRNELILCLDQARYKSNYQDFEKLLIAASKNTAHMLNEFALAMESG